MASPETTATAPRSTLPGWPCPNITLGTRGECLPAESCRIWLFSMIMKFRSRVRIATADRGSRTGNAGSAGLARPGTADPAARAGHLGFPQAITVRTTSDRAVSRNRVLLRDASLAGSYAPIGGRCWPPSLAIVSAEHDPHHGLTGTMVRLRQAKGNARHVQVVIHPIVRPVRADLRFLADHRRNPDPRPG